MSRKNINHRVLHLAPIALFVYNRPWHTEQTLLALEKNDLAEQSQLIVFADGPRADAKPEDLAKINEVRALFDKKWGFKSIELRQREKNAGLAQSIIDGVTEVVNAYGSIIVLEDDIVTAPGFLSYMNLALQKYADEPRVFHISGFIYPVKNFKKNEYFFYNQAACWGWGTWMHNWAFFKRDTNYWLEKIKKLSDSEEFNIHRSLNFQMQLENNKIKKINTWACFWQATVFFEKGLCFHPGKTFVRNIGLDGSGVNTGVDRSYSSRLRTDIPTNIENIRLVESNAHRKKIVRYFNNKESKNHSLIRRVKLKLKKIIKTRA